MSHSSDSIEVQIFLAAFAKLRDRTGDDAHWLLANATKNEALADLCQEVFNAAGRLRETERNKRDLFLPL